MFEADVEVQIKIKAIRFLTPHVFPGNGSKDFTKPRHDLTVAYNLCPPQVLLKKARSLSRVVTMVVLDSDDESAVATFF